MPMTLAQSNSALFVENEGGGHSRISKLRNFILHWSSGSGAVALDEEYVSTYFWPLLKGGF